MSEYKDEEWLDDELRRAINTTRPEFDADAWKRDHVEAYEVLVSRAKRASSIEAVGGHRMRLAVGALAAAAVILITATILLTHIPPRDGQESVTDTPAKGSSPADIVSMISLRAAYRQGGEEALDQQLDTALDALGPRPDAASALRLFGRL